MQLQVKVTHSFAKTQQKCSTIIISKGDGKNEVIVSFVCRCFDTVTAYGLILKNNYGNNVKQTGKDLRGLIKSDNKDKIIFNDKHVPNEDSQYFEGKIVENSEGMPLIGEKKAFSCPFCKLVCITAQDIAAHCQKTHLTKFAKCRSLNQNIIKKNKFTCKFCYSSYKTHSYLQKHLHIKHSEAKVDDLNYEANRAKIKINGITKFHCNVCKMNLRLKQSLIRHIRMHKGEKPFTCHICGKQYRADTDLSIHIRIVHEKLKKYKCDICGQHFSSAASCDEHKRIHTGERPFLCDVCGKSSATRRANEIHRQTHTNIFPHCCVYCKKGFRTRQHLEDHTRTHTGEKPFACDLCGKSFGVKNEVRKHRLTHSNDKPFACPQCKFCFAQKRYLKHHKKAHHLKA